MATGEQVRIDDVTRALIAAGITDPQVLRQSVAVAARESLGPSLSGIGSVESDLLETPGSASTWLAGYDPNAVGHGIFQFTPGKDWLTAPMHPNMDGWDLQRQVQYFVDHYASQQDFTPWAYNPTYAAQITSPNSGFVKAADASIQRVSSGQGQPPLTQSTAAIAARADQVLGKTPAPSPSVAPGPVARLSPAAAPAPQGGQPVNNKDEIAKSMGLASYAAATPAQQAAINAIADYHTNPTAGVAPPAAPVAPGTSTHEKWPAAVNPPALGLNPVDQKTLLANSAKGIQQPKSGEGSPFIVDRQGFLWYQNPGTNTWSPSPPAAFAGSTPVGTGPATAPVTAPVTGSASAPVTPPATGGLTTATAPPDMRTSPVGGGLGSVIDALNRTGGPVGAGPYSIADPGEQARLAGRVVTPTGAREDAYNTGMQDIGAQRGYAALGLVYGPNGWGPAAPPVAPTLQPVQPPAAITPPTTGSGGLVASAPSPSGGVYMGPVDQNAGAGASAIGVQGAFIPPTDLRAGGAGEAAGTMTATGVDESRRYAEGVMGGVPYQGFSSSMGPGQTQNGFKGGGGLTISQPSVIIPAHQLQPGQTAIATLGEVRPEGLANRGGGLVKIDNSIPGTSRYDGTQFDQSGPRKFDTGGELSYDAFNITGTANNGPPLVNSNADGTGVSSSADTSSADTASTGIATPPAAAASAPVTATSSPAAGVTNTSPYGAPLPTIPTLPTIPQGNPVMARIENGQDMGPGPNYAGEKTYTAALKSYLDQVDQTATTAQLAIDQRRMAGVNYLGTPEAAAERAAIGARQREQDNTDYKYGASGLKPPTDILPATGNGLQGGSLGPGLRWALLTPEQQDAKMNAGLSTISSSLANIITAAKNQANAEQQAFISAFSAVAPPAKLPAGYSMVAVPAGHQLVQTGSATDSVQAAADARNRQSGLISAAVR